MELTKSLLSSAFPYAKKEKIETFLGPLNETLREYQINTFLRVTSFLAQLEVESGSLNYVEELADGSAYEHRKDLGNLKEAALAAAHAAGTTTGRFYKGHGLIQITGYDNHKACGEALGLDLVNFPALLKEPRFAALSAGWYWRSHDCNDLADGDCFGAITKKINGGYNGAKERAAAYVRNKQVFNDYLGIKG